MRFSYNWLKELSGTDKTPKELAELLIMHSFEVEGVEELAKGLDGVVVGEVLEVNQHSNADKLKVVKVDVGSEELQIVCGAPNVAEGKKVPVALVGAELPNEMKIEETEIRGEKSFGMICAADELGLGDDHTGIMILNDGLKTGTSFAQSLGLDDSVLDIDILSNRGHDALSHVGMAREISALENKSLNYAFGELDFPETSNFSVEIQNSDKCLRYIGALLKGVKIQESPDWIKSRLLASGIRPINNIVDATNYVMLETGQPLHAFDFEKVKGGKIVVRSAENEEKMILLDGNEKELSEKDLVIANNTDSMALAGVMGGDFSGVTSETKDILLEAANFDAVSVRRTRMWHSIKTESSDRFEKEIDPNLAEYAMTRVVEIIKEISGGQIEGVKDVYNNKLEPWKVKLSVDYVGKLLGEEIPKSEMVRILNSLEIIVVNENETEIEVEVPTFRLDIENQEDLIEEIGRVYGYEKIEERPLMAPLKSAKVNEEKKLERRVKSIFVGNGFSEVYNYSFYGIKDANLAQLGTVKHLELENPMNPEQALLRISLLPNLLKNVRENLKNKKALEIFEIGKVYWTNGETLPEEKRMLAGAIVLEKDEKAEGFYFAKGMVDNIFSFLGIDDYYYDDFDSASAEILQTFWHGGRVADLKVEGVEGSIGTLGEVNPLVLVDFDIHKRVVMFEFDFDKLLEAVNYEKEYRPIRKYPEIVRDISMVANSDVRVESILSSIQFAGGDLVLDVDLFDVFDFEEEGKTSFAFHIIFGADDRTLKSEEVDVLMDKITSSLENDLSVKIRK